MSKHPHYRIKNIHKGKETYSLGGDPLTVGQLVAILKLVQNPATPVCVKGEDGEYHLLDRLTEITIEWEGEPLKVILLGEE